MNKKQEKLLRTQWGTPWWLFDYLNEKYNFTIDIAALPFNTKLSKYITPKQNGLNIEYWKNEIVWCNPPYDKISPWTEIAIEALEYNTISVLLLPASVGTRWFKKCALHENAFIYFFTGRIPHIPPPGIKNTTPRGDQMLIEFSPKKYICPLKKKSIGSIEFIDIKKIKKKFINGDIKNGS